MCGICSVFFALDVGIICGVISMSVSVSESSNAAVSCFLFLSFLVWANFWCVGSLSLSRSESEKRPFVIGVDLVCDNSPWCWLCGYRWDEKSCSGAKKMWCLCGTIVDKFLYLREGYENF